MERLDIVIDLGGSLHMSLLRYLLLLLFIGQKVSGTVKLENMLAYVVSTVSSFLLGEKCKTRNTLSFIHK